MPTATILAFSDYEAQARRLAEALDWPFALVQLHRFPDGESRLILPPGLPERLVVCRSLDHPNDKLVELLLTATTARELGARHLTLVAPYLCYMRQDMAFHPGEAVSQRIVGRFLGELFDAVVTVDPHLHRVDSLAEAVPRAEAVSLSAAPLAARFLRGLGERPLLVGPDGESEQWVRQVAVETGLDYRIAGKQRLGDRRVTIELAAGDYAGRDVVLVDDVASTGHTLQAVAQRLFEVGVRSVRCLVTHALCDEEALARLKGAGIGEVWSSDSIAHPTNAFGIAELLAPAVRERVS